MRQPARGLRFFTLLLLATCILGSAARSWAADFIWIEGEQFKNCSLKPDVNPSGRPGLLSDGKWLTVHADGNEVHKLVPGDAATIDYAFKAERAASYHVWGHIGYEFARSPFEWRIDDGAWKKITPDDVTIDLTELSFFTEVGWLELGTADLKPGDHKLEFRVLKVKDAKGQPQRLLFGLDAVCLMDGQFLPNGPYQPGQEYRTPRDKEAATHVFSAPATSADGSRAVLPLSGLWEVCRDDERLPGPVAEPIKQLPEHPFWRAIEVPGNKNTLRDDLVFAHRIWYRTRIDVPGMQIGNRAFYLDFPQNNLNTTVVVNGVPCGFERNPYVHFQVDVTKAIKPGVNEIDVGIRDAWYGYSASPTDPMKLRRHFNIPLQFTGSGFQDMAYPVWNAFQSGILVTPSFVTAGSTYVSDVFCKPSVAKKELAIEVTLFNPGSAASHGELLCDAVSKATGKVEKSLPMSSFKLAAGEKQVLNLTVKWEDAKLWWPDDPQLYDLRTTVHVAGSTDDVSATPFGFREWGIDGTHFTLNGQIWHGWNMGVSGSTKEEWLANYHRNHQTQMRMCGATQGGNRPFFQLAPDEALDWMDQQGVVVRRCGPLDGEAIGYMAVENDEELKKLYNSPIKIELLNNCREQMVAQVRGERNHPSVQVWSIENEWLFINCINLYGGLMDQFEAENVKTMEAVKAIDPTRPIMNDGGGATKSQGMPVHGDHYVADSNLTNYPALAYEPNVTGGGRGRWMWDQKRPRFLGEDFFYAGNHPELSTVGGEVAFGGKASTLQACGLMLQILQQGYRWSDFGAWDFYCSPGDADDSQWKYMQSRVVLCRQWDWTFGAGQSVKRSLAIFNDTHDSRAIDLTWVLTVAGQRVAGKTEAHTVAPGIHQEFELLLTMPSVKERGEGELKLSLSVGGTEVFTDSKAVSVLPTSTKAAADVRLAGLNANNFFVYDPAGPVAKFLKEQGLAFTTLADLKTLPEGAKVLLIGKDALDAADSASSRLAAYASAGRSVIVLEQKNPLRYQAIPAQIETATNEGRVAFGEDLSHPALHGLQQKDFFTWGSDEFTYRNAYLKPERGAKSLIQCDQSLRCSALVEVPAGKGLLLLSQLLIGEKLADNAVAQQLLENLLAHGLAYKQTFRPVAAVADNGSPLTKTLDSIGVQYAKAGDPLAAIATPGHIAVIQATPANLSTLAGHLEAVDKFTAGGGFIVLNGLTPEGLDSYNKLVGFEHMIRPFKRERVVFPAVRDPLLAGLSTGDVALYSSQRIFPWQDGNYVVTDEFSFVVDYDEVAPFGKSSFFAYDNIVNGFVNADGWPLIINIEIPKDGSPVQVPITFPKPQTITELTWIGNNNYFPTTKLNLIFDKDKDKAAPYAVEPTGDPQVLPINPPRKVKDLTLQITSWQEKAGSGRLVGIDNIYLKAQRPPEFYQHVKPMLNVGGMMHYVRGSGGIVLCNLQFKDSEEVPANATKKQNILATLLRNLQAPFTGGKSIIAGANLEYQPIDISKQATQFRDDKGWFGDKAFTFRDLPTGKQKLAGVPFDIYEFATSPVPTVIMLAGPNVPNKLPEEIKGIEVNRKADALFFLQAARIDQPLNQDEVKNKKPAELFHYTIHYADGKTETVPVFVQADVENYKQDGEPRAISGAQIAWSRPYEGGKQSAVAYTKQWNNPRPDIEIKSIDIGYPAARRGVPAVLAITAATAVEGK